MRETKIKINQIDYDFGEGGSGAKTITLLSVTTAPEPPFSIESRYYNSSDNLIYKAVDDNTWEDAETFEPTLGTFYIYQGQSYLYDAKTQSLFQIGEYTPEANLVTKNIILSTNTNTAPLNVDLTNAVIFGVYLNGLYQLTTEHYSVSSSAITFTSVYPAGTSITIVYSNSLTLSVHGQSGGGGNVDDVQLDGQSVLNNRIANINVGGGDNIWSYSADSTIYNNFAGYGFKKQSYILTKQQEYDEEIYIQLDDNNHNIYFSYDVRISTGTLIFRNGQLLSFMDDYDIINTGNVYIFSSLSEGDVISVINGLSVLTKITNIESNIIHCNYYINDNIVIFKNGILLNRNSDYTTQHGDIIFTTALNNNDKIVIMNCVTNTVQIDVEENSEFLIYEGPYDNIIFRNGSLLSINIDYEIVDWLGGSTWKIRFNTPLQNDDKMIFINNEPYSIYALLGDKQNSLPLYENGKVLGTDGHQLKWITQDYNNLINKPTIGGGLYIDNNEISMNKNTAFYNSLYINSKGDNISESDIQFDMNTFYTYTGGADNNFYNFIYMNGVWNLRIVNYSKDPQQDPFDYIGEVNLADYGITYLGTPFENGWFILAGNYLTGKISFTVVRLSFSNVFLNGILLTEGLDFTRNDNTITFINYTLKDTDRIQII